MTSEKAAVCAIVATYNGQVHIEACLQSLAQSHYPVTVVVVDNGSSDSTLSIVSRFPEVVLQQNNRNLGFGRANNIGMRLALEEGARWVFLLNQDARVEPKTIGELVRVSVTHPHFGVLSPFHLDGKGNELDARFANYLHRAEAQLLSDLYLDRRREVYSTAFVNAAAWLVTRDCLDTIGGFDPLFFMYGEDNDYCNRARWHGFEVGLVPNAIAFHDRATDLFPRGRQGIRLGSIIAWRFSNMLHGLKQPRGTFLRRIGSWGLTNLGTGLALLGAGQSRDFLAWIMGLMRITFCLPRIWKHRKIDREPGRHWI